MILWGIVLVSLAYYVMEITSFNFSFIALLPAILYMVLMYVKKRPLLLLFMSIYSVYLLLNIQQLFASIRVLVNEGILALAQWGILLPLQQTDTNNATIALSLIFLLLTIFSETFLGWLIIGVILLPFILQQPVPVVALCLFLCSCLLVVQYRLHKKVSFIPITLLVVICAAVLPFQSLSPVQQIGQQVNQWKNKLLYDETPATQFSNGDLQHLQPFEKTATPAFHLVMEHPRPLYLKSFVGATYENGWMNTHKEMTQELNVIKHLQQSNHFEQTQFAQATAEDENEKVSISYIQFDKKTALIPYELARPIDGFDMYGQSTKLLGTSSYHYEIDERKYNDYPIIASKLYMQHDTPYLQLETYTNYLSHQYYKEMPKEVEILLRNHFKVVDHSSYEQIIDTVKGHVSKLTYDEKVSSNEQDFLQTLLEETKAGYSVHYATLATLLFRYYGIPARYVEGYIVTNEQLQHATAYSEITVTSDSRHAWPEIYIDWLGWVPIEVTPGYEEKMPEQARTEFSQPNSATEGGAPAATSAISQQQDDPLQEEPAKEKSTTATNKWLWLLVLIPLAIAFMWYKSRKVNRLQKYFMQMIHASRKHLQTQAPVHQIIKELKSVEAKEAYRIYNEALYQQEKYSTEQLQAMRRLTKLIQKQLKNK